MTSARLLAFITMIVLAVGLWAPIPARADQLADIKSKGKLVCGTLGTSEPFSFQDPGDPRDRRLRRRYVPSGRQEPRASRSRSRRSRSRRASPSSMLGRVDILAANLGYTEERAAQIAYSDTYFVSRAEGPRARRFRADQALRARRQEDQRGEGIELRAGRAPLHPERHRADLSGSARPPSSRVEQGKVAGFCASELVLVKLKAKAASAISIIAEPLFVEEWGLGLRKEEAGFRDAVNAALGEMERSGEAARLFEHWFGEATLYKMKREFAIAPIKG